MNEKTLDYRVFLLGIVSYWMFSAIWTKVLFYLFFDLQFVLNPIAVEVVESLLCLLVFYLLFRKPRMSNIRWSHVVGVVLLMAGATCVQLAVKPLLIEALYPSGVMEDIGVFSKVMQDVRKWTNLISSVIVILFLWWNCRARNVKLDSETDTCVARSYYGGMLFYLFFVYALWLITNIVENSWSFVSHPIFLEGICYILLILVTTFAVWMLARKHLMVVPLIVILSVVAAHLFAQHYLWDVLDHQFTAKAVISSHRSLFSPVTNLCGWAFFLTAFILYRKEVKRENKVVETDV